MTYELRNDFFKKGHEESHQISGLPIPLGCTVLKCGNYWRMMLRDPKYKVTSK